jgi:DNA-binding transcriptional MerR regulator
MRGQAMTEGYLQIGEVAERARLSLRTVRYYEEQGLVVPESRTEGGFRLYTDEQVERLLLIRQMKPLGFSIQQMRELLDARDAVTGVGVEPEVREAAIRTLGEFSRSAGERCEQLREQLASATEFAASLTRYTRRARRQLERH